MQTVCQLISLTTFVYFSIQTAVPSFEPQRAHGVAVSRMVHQPFESIEFASLLKDPQRVVARGESLWWRQSWLAHSMLFLVQQQSAHKALRGRAMMLLIDSWPSNAIGASLQSGSMSRNVMRDCVDSSNKLERALSLLSVS